jgi:hypothetical protein
MKNSKVLTEGNNEHKKGIPSEESIPFLIHPLLLSNS